MFEVYIVFISGTDITFRGSLITETEGASLYRLEDLSYIKINNNSIEYLKSHEVETRGFSGKG